MNVDDSSGYVFASILKVMIFIDGGYVRQTLNDIQAKKSSDILDQRR
jgi:hypothetical protein